MKSESEKEKIELKKRLARVLRIPSNKICADCPETRPTWISFIKPQQKFALGSKVLASFVCLECAGLHRKLGTHICVVRSISHDQFEDKDVEYVEYSGNEIVNEIFEGHLQKSTMDGINIKPQLGAEVARRERFIRQKYVDLYFYRKRAHYQHISEVNKIISNARKPLKSPGSSPGSESSPTKPFRKRLEMFLRDENSASDKCSTTVGNTTNTSRTRTITDRDDSNRSDAPTRRNKKTSKKRSSKSGKTRNRKKSQKKSSSQRRLKLQDHTDPMFGMPFNEPGIARVGESSAPPKQPNMRKDLQLQELTNTGTNNQNHRKRNDLSGMILVFDEDSFESIESPQREHRSTTDLDRYRHGDTTSASSDNKSTIDTNQDDLLEVFSKKPLIKSRSEVYDPLAITIRDVKRSRSEIIIDELTRKMDRSLSPGFPAKKVLSNRNLHSTNDQYADSEKEKERQAKTPLIAHLTKDTNRNQNTSTRNLKIPYLYLSPNSPTSVEGIISEETSYGFGDETVNNMSGTGENNKTPNVEDNSTINGFKVIDSETISDNSGSNKPESKGSFTEKFKNKKETVGAIKSQSGRSITRSPESDARWDQPDDFNEINKSKRLIFNKSKRSVGNNRSIRSIGNRSNMSVVSVDEPAARMHLQRPKRQESIDCESPPSKKMKKKKSIRNISNRSNMRMSVDEPAMRKKSQRRKIQERMDSGSPSSKKTKKKKKSRRSSSIKSSMSIGIDEHVVKKKKSRRSSSNKSSMSIGIDEHVVRKKSRRPKSQGNIDYEAPPPKKNRSPKKHTKKKSKKSRSKSTSINLRNRALLDEWRRLKDENQREFEKLRTENQRKFDDFNQHFSQHIHL